MLAVQALVLYIKGTLVWLEQMCHLKKNSDRWWSSAEAKFLHSFTLYLNKAQLQCLTIVSCFKFWLQTIAYPTHPPPFNNEIKYLEV